jgi:hypothetical protein
MIKGSDSFPYYFACKRGPQKKLQASVQNGEIKLKIHGIYSLYIPFAGEINIA